MDIEMEYLKELDRSSVYGKMIGKHVDLDSNKKYFKWTKVPNNQVVTAFIVMSESTKIIVL